jgi:hypothetical protein
MPYCKPRFQLTARQILHYKTFFKDSLGKHPGQCKAKGDFLQWKFSLELRIILIDVEHSRTQTWLEMVSP